MTADGGSTSRSQRHVYRETFILFELEQERVMCTSASLDQKYRLAYSVFVMAALWNRADHYIFAL